MRRLKRCALLGRLLPALMLLTAGCGDQSKTVKVEGIVTLDGKPLPHATVTFSPSGNSRAATGRADTDGRFRLTTFRTDDGALPGEYKVLVVVEKEADERFVGRDPETFTNQEKLESRKTMSPAGKKAAAAAKKKATSQVPAIYGDVKQTPLKEVVPPTGKVELALRSGAG